jgi:hypothetical protein
MHWPDCKFSFDFQISGLLFFDIMVRHFQLVRQFTVLNKWNLLFLSFSIFLCFISSSSLLNNNSAFPAPGH